MTGAGAAATGSIVFTDVGSLAAATCSGATRGGLLSVAAAIVLSVGAVETVAATTTAGAVACVSANMAAGAACGVSVAGAT